MHMAIVYTYFTLSRTSRIRNSADVHSICWEALLQSAVWTCGRHFARAPSSCTEHLAADPTICCCTDTAREPLNETVATTLSLATTSLWGSSGSLSRARPLPRLFSKTAHGLNDDRAYQFQYSGFRR